MHEADASQFYTGLVAELYEPLVSYRARAEEYMPFLERSGTPALELGCGSGVPMLDLLARGFEVEGLDSSPDMLARCREQAEARGLSVVLYQQTMQDMAVPRRYRSIYLAGATFTLLPSDDDARRVLARIHDHLLPGGSALIPLSIPDPDAAPPVPGKVREFRSEDGTLLRFGVVSSEVDFEGRCIRGRSRYERLQPGQAPEVLERDGLTRFWGQELFRDMLLEAGFARVSARDPRGGRASPTAKAFVFVAQR